MIISFCGDNGSGKSTTAIKVADNLGYKHYHMGQILRGMAKEKNITLEELNELRNIDQNFDKSVDDFVIKLGKQNNDFVIESRTAWFFIPHSLKIYLKVNNKEAARRIYLELKNENNRNEGKDLDSEEKVLESVAKRNSEDDIRYHNLYNIDIRDEKNFDFILDTTNLSIEEVFQKVMEFIRSKNGESN
jgi:cytidylate kinase